MVSISGRCKVPIILAAWLLLFTPAHADPFQTFQQRYAAAAPADRVQVAAAFLAEQAKRGGFPLVAPDGTVTFVFRGDGSERSVALTGDHLPQSPLDFTWRAGGKAMTPLVPGGALYVYRRRFPPDARVDYQIVVDGKPRTDPLNPRRRDGAIYGHVSELVMPGYNEPAHVARLDDAPLGRPVTVPEPWANLRVRVYLPPGYDPAKRYPVIYTADGAAWSDHLRLPQWLDQLIAAKRIRPAIAVMIDAPEDRRRFYNFAPDYLAYLERVVRYVDATYATIATPAGRAHFGTSAGARAALYAALERPDLIGNIALLSPSISGPPSWWGPLFSGARKMPKGLKAWVSAGSYEAAIDADARAIEALFRREGVPVATRYTREGHSTATWRNGLPEALGFFYGTGSASREAQQRR